MGYLDRRQNALTGAPVAELEKLLATIAHCFDEPWLSQKNEHPLQLLWKRRDGLATCELFLLGDSILKMGGPADPWVRGQVKKVRHGDANGRRGALFEIFGLGLFVTPGVSVQPTAASNPGYDGVVQFPSGAKLFVSVKAYGPSTHLVLSIRKPFRVTVDGLKGPGERVSDERDQLG